MTRRVSIFPPGVEVDEQIKMWITFTGEKEDGPTYSEVLSRNTSFKDYATASILSKGTNIWFTNILLGQEDVMFGNHNLTRRQRVIFRFTPIC